MFGEMRSWGVKAGGVELGDKAPKVTGVTIGAKEMTFEDAGLRARLRFRRDVRTAGMTPGEWGGNILFLYIIRHHVSRLMFQFSENINNS
jgi:hypothetical protein